MDASTNQTASTFETEDSSSVTVPQNDSESSSSVAVPQNGTENSSSVVTLKSDNENSSTVETPLDNTEGSSSVDAPQNTEVKDPKEQKEINDDDSLIDDFSDIDLSAIEIASNALEQMESSMKSSETYDNLMGACSSTAQALKQTISDVLKSREKIVLTAGDTTSELEESLSKKIADFENVVSGCFVAKDVKTDLTNIKHPAFSNVIITEVDETSEEVNSDSTSSTSQIFEEKKSSSPEKSLLDTSESNLDARTLPKTDKTADIIDKDSCEVSNKKGSSKEVKSTKAPVVQSESVSVSNSIEDDKNSKKQQKYNSNKKKGEKTTDQVLKSLSNCSTTEEKLQTLCKKHVEVLEELRLFEPRMKQLERQVVSQQREKEQLQTEHNRMILAKSRLESLCRELQRQNKAVKEESLLRIKEEEERRKEIANKFQVTLNDISALMQEHSKKNIQLREENAELAKKLKALVDHYDMWEKHMEKVVQQNHLEAQLAKAKHAKINLLLKQETEKFLREKQSLLENMSELQKKCTVLTSNELKLRTELGDYTSKYEEFQTVLNKSSQVFASFKTDMEATSKKIKKLEKETNVYKQKWESSNNALLGMINDKQKHDKELSNAQQRILTLEKLCRALQAERNELQNQLNVVSDSSKKDVPSPAAETPVT